MERDGMEWNGDGMGWNGDGMEWNGMVSDRDRDRSVA